MTRLDEVREEEVIGQVVDSGTLLPYEAYDRLNDLDKPYLGSGSGAGSSSSRWGWHLRNKTERPPSSRNPHANSTETYGPGQALSKKVS